MHLYDIAPDGRVLLGIVDVRSTLMVLPPGESVERDLSWFAHSEVADLSDDGQWLLFNDRTKEGTFVFLRRTDGSPAVRLGEGFGWSLSPDGKWVAAFSKDALVLFPTGPGQPVVPKMPTGNFAGVWFNPDGALSIAVMDKTGKSFDLSYGDRLRATKTLEKSAAG